MGVIWFAVLLFMGQVLDLWIHRSITGAELILEALCGFFLLLFSLILVTAPWRERRRMLHTPYAITGRCVILCSQQRKPWIRILAFNGINQIRVNIKSDGVGDVTIIAGARVVGATIVEDKDGFYHIRNPKIAAKRLETQLKITIH